MTNPLHPEKMTARERLSEVADILARGFLRMSKKAETGLDLSQKESVHTLEPAWKGEKIGAEEKQ